MNIVYFDLETQKSAEEVGGWANKKKMRVSFGVSFSTEADCFRGYEEEDIPELISTLTKAELVIGYNIIGFDYPVLSAYSDLDFAKLPTLDLMTDLRSALGFRPKLDNLAMATLKSGKSAEGLQAIQWFREGAFAKIALYCKEDVRITRDLHRFGCAHRFVYYTDKWHRPQKAPVNWSL
ncbi:MAG: ribonuclease H-like domain-containing protein [Nitrospiria bacterium]